MSRFLCLFLFLLSSALAAPIPKSIKKNSTLDGNWEVVTINIGESDYTGKAGQKWTVDGESLKLDGYNEASKRIDKLVRVDNNGLDWVIDEAGTQRTYKGIYDIEDGQWRFCFSTIPDTGSRPSTIGKAPNVYLYTFKLAEGK